MPKPEDASKTQAVAAIPVAANRPLVDSTFTLAVITGIWLIMFGFIQFTIAGQIRRTAH